MQTNVLDYLEKGALRTCPQKTAIVDHDRQMTFAELAGAAHSCAARIIQRKNVLNQPIAVFLPKCLETVVADIGIIYSGNTYANLDVKSPDQRIRNILNNINPCMVITSASLQTAVQSYGIEPGRILLVEAIEADSAPDHFMLIRRLEAVIDTDPLCIINTSGSTGIPKGVVMNHRSVIDFMDWLFARLRLDGSEIIGSLSPFYFDIYTLELYLCLAKGATMVLIPDQLAIFPVKLVEFLEAKAVSFIFWVPTIMVNIANQDLLSAANLQDMKKILFAGEVFPTKHFNYWRRHLPQAMFVNLYGPIEITVDCTYFVVDRDFKDDEPLPIGFPCRNSDILILNEQHQPAKVNEPGELCVRGSCLAMGYWNDPEKTAKAFVQNPLNPHYPELIYRTGDLVFTNERGEIMFLGRKDYQIKHLGYRIELGEIEHIVSSMEGIDNACVLYHKEKKEITLIFEAKRKIDSAAIRQHVMKTLPKYMVPTVFYQLESMPRNPNGKIDRHQLTLTCLGK